ncbi:MAG: hypothetical protein H8M99_02190 [Gloeobacteraceae cyanobacterium ES-bin-144]|nr:hypothetical protein [Verrucomicrobiales bacterium]
MNLLYPLIALGLALPLAAETLTLTTKEGRGADASVTGSNLGDPPSHNKNFGAEPKLGFKGSRNLSYHADIYLRFDLAPLTKRKVTSAKLLLGAADGWNYGITGVSINLNPPGNQNAAIDEIRISKSFADLLSGQNALASDSFDAPSATALNGLSSGTGWAGPWQTKETFSKVGSTTAIAEGKFHRAGGLITMRGTASRKLATPIKQTSGSVWVVVMLQSTNASRTVSFSLIDGDDSVLSVSHRPIQGVGFVGKTIPSNDKEMSRVVARIDFSPIGNEAWFWANPPLDKEPDKATAQGYSRSILSPKSKAASLYGLIDGYAGGADADNADPNNQDELGEDWDEMKLNWDNAPANVDGALGNRTFAGNAYHLYSLDLQGSRDGLEIPIPAKKIAWFLNQDTNGLATFILEGHEDRSLDIGSKEGTLLPPPRLIVEVE